MIPAAKGWRRSLGHLVIKHLKDLAKRQNQIKNPTIHDHCRPEFLDYLGQSELTMSAWRAGPARRRASIARKCKKLRNMEERIQAMQKRIPHRLAQARLVAIMISEAVLKFDEPMETGTGTHAARSSHAPHTYGSPHSAVAQGLEVSRIDVLQHQLLQAQLRDQRLSFAFSCSNSLSHLA
jgi:hypothetical protein